MTLRRVVKKKEKLELSRVRSDRLWASLKIARSALWRAGGTDRGPSCDARRLRCTLPGATCREIFHSRYVERLPGSLRGVRVETGLLLAPESLAGSGSRLSGPPEPKQKLGLE